MATVADVTNLKVEMVQEIETTEALIAPGTTLWISAKTLLPSAKQAAAQTRGKDAS